MTFESGTSPNVTRRLELVDRLLRIYLVAGCLGGVVILIAVALGLHGSIPAWLAAPMFGVGGLLLGCCSVDDPPARAAGGAAVIVLGVIAIVGGLLFAVTFVFNAASVASGMAMTVWWHPSGRPLGP